MPASFSIEEFLAGIVSILILVGTVVAIRKALTNRILTPLQTVSTILLWAGYAAAFFGPLVWGSIYPGLTSRPETTAVHVALGLIFFVALSLLPLTAAALASWSVSLIRHR